MFSFSAWADQPWPQPERLQCQVGHMEPRYHNGERSCTWKFESFLPARKEMFSKSSAASWHPLTCLFTRMRIKPLLKVANRPFSVRWWMLLCALLLRLYFGSTPVTQMATTTLTMLVQFYVIICPLSCQSEQLICHKNKMINSIFLSEIMRTNMQTMAGFLGLICVTNHLVRYNATS